jgi:small subunit ribosomal protein S21
LKVEVKNNNVEKAMRIMKKKLKKEGIFDELKKRQYYTKPSALKREDRKQRRITIKKAEKLRRNFL